MAKVLVITHNDFDGVFSGAMMLTALRKKKIIPALVITTPRRLAKTLTQQLGSFTLPDEVYITDLALNADLETEVLNVLHQMQEKGKKVYWIDHHRWDRDVLQRVTHLCESCIVKTSAKTAAQLIKDEIFPDDPDVAKLWRLLYHKPPEKDSEWAKSWLDYLTKIQDTRDFNKITASIIRLAYKDQPGGMSQFFLWFSRLGKRAKSIDQIAARKEMTSKNHSLVVADLRGSGININSSYRDLVSLYNTDIYLAVLDNTRLQLGRGNFRNFNTGPLHGTHKIGGATFEIRGHKYVASVTVNAGFMSKLKALFSKKYPAEIESFIALIKEKF